MKIKIKIMLMGTEYEICTSDIKKLKNIVKSVVVNELYKQMVSNGMNKTQSVREVAGITGVDEATIWRELKNERKQNERINR